jgi:peptidyl-prolyl cis-trans isomerase C
MKKFAIALAAATALTFVQAHAEDKPAAPGKDYVILKVNGQDIRKSEVDAIFKSMFGGALGGNMPVPTFESFDANVQHNILRGIVTETLLAQQAEKEGLENRPEVKDRLKYARQQVLVQALIHDKTADAITDDKLKAEYEKQAKGMGGQDEVHARHILVKTEAEANAIYDQLKKGADFDKLAREKSEDKASGAKGGDLGYFTADRMVPDFSKAAFALKKGEISKPVKTDFGWHIIKVEDRRKSTPPTFDQVKPQLKEQVGNKIMMDYVQDLMKKADVKYLGPDGKPLPADVISVPPAAAAGTAKPAEKK